MVKPLCKGQEVLGSICTSLQPALQQRTVNHNSAGISDYEYAYKLQVFVLFLYQGFGNASKSLFSVASRYLRGQRKEKKRICDLSILQATFIYTAKSTFTQQAFWSKVLGSSSKLTESESLGCNMGGISLFCNHHFLLGLWTTSWLWLVLRK